MKTILLALVLILSFTTFNKLEAKDIKQNEIKLFKLNKEEKEDPAKICRYYAIMEANNTGYEYGSPNWQVEYLFYYRSCMDQMQ